jgi:hypothetical protein
MIKDTGKGDAAMGSAGRAGKPVNVIVEVKKRRRAQTVGKALPAKTAPPRTARDGDKRGA